MFSSRSAYGFNGTQGKLHLFNPLMIPFLFAMGIFFRPKPRLSGSVPSANSKVIVQSYRPINTRVNFTNGTKSRKSVAGFRGRGQWSRRGSGNKVARLQVTREELDKELDAYMKKGKHRKIDASDLMEN